MGFFDKVKQSLNIGGAKVVLQLGQTTIANGGTLPVKVTVQGGKLEQKVSSLTVVVKQHDTWTEHKLGGQNTRRSQDITLAKKVEAQPFTLQAGEQKEFSFELPIQAPVSSASQSGGIMGALSKLNDMASRQQHSWSVETIAAIDGSVDASAKTDLTVTLS